MKGVFFAVVDANGEVVSFDSDNYGTTKAVFDYKNDATRVAMKYRKDGFSVRTVGFMHVVEKNNE